MEGIVTLEELNLSPEDAHEHATTSDYFDLIKLLAKLNVRSKTIVDLGCGTGSAIAIFRLFGFLKVYGVELSDRLAMIATTNFSSSDRIEIIHSDARRFNKSVDFVYMFNPFPLKVLIECLQNLKTVNGNITIIYRNPIFIDEIKKQFLEFYVEKFRVVTANSNYVVFNV
jgi:SAM-dependent methyltransferase